MKNPGFDPKDIIADKKGSHPSNRGVKGKSVKRKLPSDVSKANVSGADPHTKFKYHNGPVVNNPQVYSIYLGNWKSAANKARAVRLNQFLTDLVGSSYMYILSQYGCGNSGKFIKDAYIANTDNNLSEADIHTMLQNAINSKAIPEPVNHSNVYMVFLDNNTGVRDTGLGITMCEAHSDNAFGYHNVFKTAAGNPCNYAIIPGLSTKCLNETCGGDKDCSLKLSQTREARQTQVTSHEFAEMVSNPKGDAWHDGDGSENGDICNGIPGTIVVSGRTWTVQRMYSKFDDLNSGGTNICVLPPSGPIAPLAANIVKL